VNLQVIILYCIWYCTKINRPCGLSNQSKNNL